MVGCSPFRVACSREKPQTSIPMLPAVSFFRGAARCALELHPRNFLVGGHDFVAHLHHQLKTERSAFSTAIRALCTSAPLPSITPATLVSAWASSLPDVVDGAAQHAAKPADSDLRGWRAGSR